MIKVDCPQKQIDRRPPVCRTKLVFKLKQEFDVSNPYMKFGRNGIKND